MFSSNRSVCWRGEDEEEQEEGKGDSTPSTKATSSEAAQYGKVCTN